MKISLLCDVTATPDERGPRRIAYDSTYPFLLDRKLKASYGAGAPLVLERAVPYRGILGVLDDWKEEVILKRPEIVVVHAGGGDARARDEACDRPISAEAFGHKLDELVFRAKRDGVSRLVLVTLLPNVPAPNAAAYDAQMRSRGASPHVDVVDVAALASRSGGPRSLSEDGIRFNEIGHRLVAAELDALVARAVEAPVSYARMSA